MVVFEGTAGVAAGKNVLVECSAVVFVDNLIVVEYIVVAVEDIEIVVEDIRVVGENYLLARHIHFGVSFFHKNKNIP